MRLFELEFGLGLVCLDEALEVWPKAYKFTLLYRILNILLSNIQQKSLQSSSINHSHSVNQY